MLRLLQPFPVPEQELGDALRIDYGQADHPVLLAVRHNDEEVRLEGLSTGTADQLLLALRIVALEEYPSTSPQTRRDSSGQVDQQYLCIAVCLD